jgi:hypothetical protein
MASFINVLANLTIILTAVLGVIGIVCEHRRPNGKLTRWGKVTVIGILASCSVALVAKQLQASRHDRQWLPFRQAIGRAMAWHVERTQTIIEELGRDVTGMNDAFDTLTQQGEAAQLDALQRRQAKWAAHRKSLIKAEEKFKENLQDLEKDINLYGPGIDDGLAPALARFHGAASRETDLLRAQVLYWSILPLEEWNTKRPRLSNEQSQTYRELINALSMSIKDFGVVYVDSVDVIEIASVGTVSHKLFKPSADRYGMTMLSKVTDAISDSVREPAGDTPSR